MLRSVAVIAAAAALAFAALGKPSAFAQLVLHKYVGSTMATFDGASGYFTLHRACDREFPGSVMCTSQMIVEGGPDAGALDPPAGAAWVNPAPVGTASVTNNGLLIDLFVTDFSVRTQSQPLQSLNCVGWNSNLNTNTGLVLQTLTATGTDATFSNRICNLERAVACCRFPSGVKIEIEVE